MNMGMATYPMNDVGFYVDHEVAAYILLAADQAAGTAIEKLISNTGTLAGN